MTSGGLRHFTIAIAALALASCGGDDSGDYEADLQGALGELAGLEEVAAEATDSRALATGVRELVASFDRTAAELEEIDPPGDVAASHTALIAAINDLADALLPVAEAAEADDEAALQRSADDLRAEQRRFGERLAALSADLEANGVDVTLVP